MNGVNTKPIVSPCATFALVLLFFTLPVVNWLAFGPHVPEGTFFLISQLEHITSSSDPSNIIYSFARPPIYFLLGWVFSHPWSFLIAGFLSHGTFNLLVFAIAYKGISLSQLDREAISPIVAATLATALTYPIALVVGVAGGGTSLLPHDTYHQFSFRTIFASVAAFSYLFVLNRQPARSLLIAGVSCYIHPTAGFLLLSLLTLALSPDLLKNRQRNVLAAWCAAMIIGAAPMLANMLFFNMPASLSEGMSYGDWYSLLIKDEADDFSVLYQFLVYPMHTARLFVLIVFPLFVYAKLFPDFRTHRNFWFAAAIPCLFLVTAVLELLFAVALPTPLVHLLSALTPGYRLLSFAFFPLIVIFSRILHFYFLRFTRLPRFTITRDTLNVTAVLLVVFSCLALIATGLSSGRVVSSLGYGKWAWQAGEVPGIDEYLDAAQSSGTNLYFAPMLRAIEGEVVIYPNERNILKIRMMDRAQPWSGTDVDAVGRLGFTEFMELVQRIRAAIPQGSGLIIPPYMQYFRDALPGHPIFFQEHHDGNLMMGSPVFMKFWTDRMIDLLGFSYEGMPSKYSGLSISFMREAYLGLTDTELKEILTKYPDYPYLVTEVDHVLRFAIVIKTSSFLVYDLRQPE